MPQASDEDRERMTRWFGDIMDTGPLALLESRGWIEQGGMLTPPVPSYDPSAIEKFCLWFLQEEWDYDAQIMRYKDMVGG